MRATNFTHRILLQLIIKFIGLRVEIIKVIIVISNIIHTVTTAEKYTFVYYYILRHVMIAHSTIMR
jgi:hypothetical protein